MLNSSNGSYGFLLSINVRLLVFWEISLHCARIFLLLGLSLQHLDSGKFLVLWMFKPSFCSPTLNLDLKCFTSRNVFPVCRAVRSLHQQVFTTPVNLLSGGESLSFYHRRLGEPFFLFFFNFILFVIYFQGGKGVGCADTSATFGLLWQKSNL